MKLKYVITSNNEVVLFTATLTHSHMVRKENAKSAGFASLHEVYTDEGEPRVKVSCYGESLTLGLRSLPEDSEIVSKAINGSYYD